MFVDLVLGPYCKHYLSAGTDGQYTAITNDYPRKRGSVKADIVYHVYTIIWAGSRDVDYVVIDGITL